MTLIHTRGIIELSGMAEVKIEQTAPMERPCLALIDRLLRLEQLRTRFMGLTAYDFANHLNMNVHEIELALAAFDPISKEIGSLMDKLARVPKRSLDAIEIDIKSVNRELERIEQDRRTRPPMDLSGETWLAEWQAHTESERRLDEYFDHLKHVHASLKKEQTLVEGLAKLSPE